MPQYSESSMTEGEHCPILNLKVRVPEGDLGWHCVDCAEPYRAELFRAEPIPKKQTLATLYAYRPIYPHILA